MKKLFYLFTMVFSIMFSACSNDDGDNTIKNGEFDGVYLGKLDVDAGIITAKDIVQKVYITKTGENLLKMELKNFSFQTIALGDIAVNNIKAERKGDNCAFSGAETITLEVGVCDVSVTGTITGNRIDMTINVTVTSLNNMKVTVTFSGSKLAADLDSEAKILTFTFDNPLVIAQPIMDGLNITIPIDETITDDQLKTLAPVITISKNAKITPASGTAQDFTKPVTYTVVSEDGITTTVYTATALKTTGMDMNFDEWEKVFSTTNGHEDKFYETPVGTFGTSNPGIMTLNDMVGEMVKYFDFPITKVAGRSENGVLLSTIHSFVLTNDGKDFNAALGGLIPYVTSGSLFTGSFKTDMGNPLNSTKFGIPFLGKPVLFSGYYKYTPGKVFIDEKNKEVADKTDKCSIFAVLYEEKLDNKNNNIPLTGDFKNPEVYIGSSSRIIMRAFLEDGSAKAEWTKFTLPFRLLEGKSYDPSKKYYLAVICSSSFEGDYYRGAPGSALAIDDFSVIAGK